MKKIFYFMSMAAVVFAMASCKDKAAEEVSGGGSSKEIVPNRIIFADAFQEYFMSDGESVELRYSVSPANVNVKYTLEWKTSDKSVVEVNGKGEATAQGVGEATITVSIPEYPDVKPAQAKITVLAQAKVGDYIYSDGSWGEDPNPSEKSVIAVIYWIGNASLYDPILEQDYPNCTHGLAMSLKQGKAGQWMKDFEYYFENTDDPTLSQAEKFRAMGNGPFCDNAVSLTEWGVTNSSYADKILPYFENQDLWAGEMFPGVGGYTYTAVLEQYTREYPNAGKYPFEFYLNAMALVDGIEAPLTTSRWYVPSIFEAALMVNTALTKPKDFNNTRLDDDKNPLIQHNNANVAVINAALSQVSGADLIPTEPDHAIASATDIYFSYKLCCDFMECPDFCELVYVCQNPKGQNAEKAAQIEKAWADWLKEKAPEDKYEEYKAYTEYKDASFDITTRYEVYLNIMGYDGATYASKVSGAMLNALVSLLTTNRYANVSTTTGMLQLYDMDMVGGLPCWSGCKGEDNANDVVRAIIAF